MSLNSHQRQFLKAQAHSLKPVVLLGNDGLSENVIKEIESSIEHHELIKIRTNAGLGRKDQALEAANAVNAELVSGWSCSCSFPSEKRRFKIHSSSLILDSTEKKDFHK